ncbi:hypothetical protein [Methylomonas lenta]|uniref:hypothetical protein n=1 Tax=Methylomonas lenta TaxID=980561 RepID=UPI0012F6B4B9|nr:hypothetical protein [Methylomonas lenta]
MKPKLESLLHEYGLADKVLFVARQTFEGIIDTMRNGYIFVLPSLKAIDSNKGFDIVYLEVHAY